MFRVMCKSKITGASITDKKLYYDGSIGIDKRVIELADILPGEQVHVLNVNNGERFTTYVIEEAPNSGKIILYGPAARMGEEGDELVILSYCMLSPEKCEKFKYKVARLSKQNKIFRAK
ncbi:Aspartate decarboxylase [Candidatus Omnitrophus magneticus]|uniref:Aspartate 1-decarboxylase n=1 Tax=Candidatus Omnitrophus magneticus TaxID=1609969 RepID=A0A0F0CR91_9BACT|nr:Aspartate decarboxylase [Candidatus Omnitrophus magneticus]